MKKLSIEEKAQAYDEAIKKLRNFYRDYDTVSRLIDVKEELANLFPQLKESEDERIRKAIYNCVEWFGFDSRFFRYASQKDCLTWLEKQSEHKEINLVEVLKHYPRETKLYSPLYGKLWLAEVDEEHEIITCYKYPLENGCTRAVIEQEETVSFYSDGTTGLPDFNISKDCMLFLYNNKKQDEQKTVDEIAKEVCKDKASAVAFLKSTGIINENGELADEYKIEQGEKNPAWSEEDEKKIAYLIALLQNSTMHNSALSAANEGLEDWLKSLKNKVQPQPKQEWSKEDERKINRIYSILRQAADTHAFSTSCRLIGDKECIELQDFLHLLKDRNTWKPSDEQMKFLWKYAEQNNYDGRVLTSLYQDLKKLKG